MKNIPIIRKAKLEQPKSNQDDDANLTPVQRMKLKKQREAERQGEMMKQAAVDSQKNYNFAQQKKNEQLYSAQSNSSNQPTSYNPMQQTAFHMPP